MKKIYFLFVLFIFYGIIANAQDYRYTKTIFDNVNVTTDVVYGTAEFLNSNYFDESATTTGDLLMDIYEPQGDTHTNRPVIIFAHGGGFSTGNKNVDDMEAFCDTFARKGYVTVTIDYRQGVEVADNGDMHYTRAAYRGFQDGRTAVRFLRANAATYGIDADKVYWGGNSAGSFIGLNNVFLDNDELPADVGAVSYSIGVVPYSAPSLGALDIGDNLSYNGEPDAVMSCWGGIGDLDNIELENNQNVFLVHGTADDIVPFNSGAPFGLSGISDVFGSGTISERLENIGMPAQMTYFVEGENHEFYGVDNGMWENGTGGNAYWDTIVIKATEFYWLQHKPTADFSFETNVLDATFTDESSGALSFSWNFGDGTTSTFQNPVHSYSTTGQYEVTLYIENSDFSWDEITQTVFVTDSPMSGTYYIGDGAGDDYTTLYSGLLDLYANGIDGAVVFELSADYDSAPTNETYPVYIQEIPGSSYSNTFTIKPAEDVDVVFEFTTIGEMSAVFAIIDASNVIIDGSNNGTDSRNITIQNTAEMDETAPIALFTDAVPGDNITIKNCIIKAHSNNYENAGIYSNLFTNVTLENNIVSNCDLGIIIDGGSDINVINNTIGSDIEADYVKSGIGFYAVENATAVGNTVKNLYGYANDGNLHGIFVNEGTGNIEIAQNVVKNMVHTGDSIVQALAFYMVDANTLKIVNNHISGLASDSYEDNYPAGIAIICPDMTNGIKINYNSIYLSENNEYGAGISGDANTFVAGISIGGGYGIIMKNNIIHNALGERDGSTNSTFGVAVLSNAVTSPFSQIDNNIYYAEGDYDYTYLAMTMEGGKNLADWQTWTGQDASSYFADAMFVSKEDLNVEACSPAIAHGVQMNGVSTDINDSTRHATNPTIGAYEYEMIQASEVFKDFPTKTLVSSAFYYTEGNGCRKAIFVKEGDATLDPAMPVNGTTYTSSATFGLGDQIGTSGWYCVAIQDQIEEIVVEGLTEATDYTIMVCEYFGEDGDEYYLTNTETNNTLLFTANQWDNVIETTNNISIYPNPATDILNIDTPENINSASITDITGKTVYTTNHNINKIDVSSLTSGIYLLKINTNNGVYNQKVIIK